ncbi:MAG: four helix bundle protein [Bdellovibrionota bacterium]
MKTFRTLELAIEFHGLIDSMEIQGHLRDQLFRATTSISLNLSEGNAKRSAKEKKRFYQTAYASLQECKTILQLTKSKDEKIIDTADKLGAWIFNLLKSEIPTLDFRNT